MKRVVITGSTRGIGLSMAEEFLRAGCKVTISGRAAEPSDTLKETLKSHEESYQYVSCNVRSYEDVDNLWKAAQKQWGGIDIWINNAGQNVPHEFCYYTDAVYVDAVIDTNIKGIIYGSQIAAKHMLEQGFGQIWNMEGLGSNDMIQVKTILYGTTKRALTYFTKGLAKELKGTPVLAGLLSPGMVLTEFMTKTPEGETSPVLQDKSFQFVFNNLGDRPETVASFFIPRILRNKKNNAHIEWLTNTKAFLRMLKAPFFKRRLI
jgi:NAD(P)-dependent dehydrogenase (short-subunit alcohol dehydrogenase family)